MPDDQASPVDAAAAALYAVPPDEFMSTRGEFAARARAAGDSAAAAAITRLRKPTVAAWIVNAYALDSPEVVDRLVALGEQLRSAQTALDATRLRELTAQRRGLIAQLCRDAFAHAGRAEPPAGLRDEVSGTFDAALADPEVAGRLGRLQRAEQWSGFGFAPAGAPELTLLRGGRDDPQHPETERAPKVSAAQRRKQQRVVAAARADFDAADSAHEQARAGEHGLAERVRQLTGELARLQGELDEARGALERARHEVGDARARRRAARTALDRAERQSGD